MFKCIYLLLVLFTLFSYGLIANKLENKVCIITGGAQGIGKAIANTFAKEGAIVVIIDVKDELASEVVNTLVSSQKQAQFIHCDVANEDEVEKAVNQVNQQFGKIDILVNNAAIAIYKQMEDYTPSEWNKVISVNLNSIFYFSRCCLPIMKKNSSGNIILIASVHTRTTSKNNNPYVASKGAIASLTRAMALEGAPYNIRVNCISPGAILTPMLMENWGALLPEQHPLLPRIPLNRLGTPDEIAQVALFIASDDSSYITGSELLVDGGLSAHFD